MFIYNLDGLRVYSEGTDNDCKFPTINKETEQIPALLDGGGGAAYLWFTSVLSVPSMINVGLT